MTSQTLQASPEEETLLAQYLIERVTHRASGTLEDECLYNAPRDKYFIGSLRPTPREDEAHERPNFLNELMNKLAPMAFGSEFRVNPRSNEFKLKVSIRWSCYYRVFPSFAEQLRHQGLGQDGGNGGNGQQQNSNSADSLFRKYRKIKCCAKGDIALRKSGATWNESVDINLGEIRSSIESEIQRAKQTLLADPERLRLLSLTDARILVPTDALRSTEAFDHFKRSLAVEISPDWRWGLDLRLRPEDKDCVCVIFEATNSSQVDPNSWHSEGFFFDIGANVSFEDAEVRPFELELAPKNFRYDRQLWGRGFNCAVDRIPDENGQAVFSTTNTPIYSQARYATNNTPAASFSDLASDPKPVLLRILDAMQQYGDEWRSTKTRYTSGDSNWESKHGQEYEADYLLFQEEIGRFKKGCEILSSNPDVFLAFQLTNQAFSLGGQKTAWRLFQIVFLVSQIPGIAALQSEDPQGLSDRELVDIVYFPTGGGKTEAYLGTIVFHCFFDRLRGKTAGVTVWTRFPLRLLTLQQNQRVVEVIGLADLVRKRHPDRRLSGPTIDGFSVGYFVGQEATPNKISPPNQWDPSPDWSIANDPQARQRWKKIVRCPSCRTPTVTIDFDTAHSRLLHRCTNATCQYTDGVLPVYVVDNEIYRYLPSVVVGTIDKLASLGNQRKLSLVLGQVTGKCSLHGYYNVECCQKECGEKSRLKAGPPPGVSGPTLFVQDELHLLKEGLGTFDGHYETFLQRLLSSFGQKASTKIIASSATIEAFDRQVLHLYGRRARVFPGFGPTLNQSFYARTLNFPQRIFVGVLPHNKTIFNAVLELFQYYQEEVGALVRLPSGSTNPFGGQTSPNSPEWKRLLDFYVTLLGYFSATRELNSFRTDLEGHVNSELEQSGFDSLRIAELSGSTSTDNVTQILESLETSVPLSSSSPNAVLATSMISHGVDVDRFNCMVFYGMPRQNAEYIQSSSRVGRAHVGIVFVCLKPARERDQSHFSYFSKYHEFLGQLVEPVAINRWSKFSLQRTIPGLFMAILLQRISNLPGVDKPGRYYNVDFIKRLITTGGIRAEDFLEMLDDSYLMGATGEAADALRIEIGNRVRQFFDQILGAGMQTKFVSNALIPPPMISLRDVDDQISIELDSNGNDWAGRITNRQGD